MNIVIISKQSVYKELFEMHEEITTVLLWDQVKESNINIDVVLLDGEIYDINQLSEVRELYPDQIIYFRPLTVNSDVIMKKISRLSAAYKVKVLNEYLTFNQVVEEVVNQVTNRQDYISKRVISIFGTHSGAGVSTTTLNLARSLSQRVKDKVLVLSLNSWDPSDYFYNYDGQYLNDLKVDLKTKSLTVARLNEAVTHYQGFYHLAGNRDIKMQRFYQPQEIEHLINVAKEVFDVILIDAGTHFDNAPTVQAYMSSNLKFLVTTQEEKGYRGYFPHVFQQVIEPVGGVYEDFVLVVNKYQPSNTLINDKALEEELNMTKVSTIPDMGDLGSMAAYQKKLLYDVTDDFYQRNIDLISNLIISEAHLNEIAINEESKAQKKRKFFFLKS